MKTSRLNKDLFTNLVVALMVGLLLLMIGWVKSDIDRLNTKVDQLTATYVQVTGELTKKMDE